MSGCIQDENTVEKKMTGFNKLILKDEIEEIGKYTYYIPTVSLITLKNDTLFIEYSSFELGNNSIFDEQQKIANVIVEYFDSNEFQKPNIIKLRVNGITNEYTDWYPVFDTEISWDNLVKFSNLELSFSDWLSHSNSKKVKK